MSYEEIIAWVRRFRPYATEEECLEHWRIYKSYRDEGERHIVCKQYAGLL